MTKMKTTIKAVLATFALLLSASFASAQQNTLIQTTLSQAQDASSTVIQLASLTGITFGPNGSPTQPNSQTILYINEEQENVLGITGNAVHVSRGQAGTRANAHVSGAVVLAGRPVWFYRFDPSGACVTANVYVTPWVNVIDGLRWLCSPITLSWVPGFNNTTMPARVTAAVASAAGAITPTGPLFHITGALAITSFTVPVGGVGGNFCVIPDGAYTTTATNNIGSASTATVGRVQCWTWDSTTSKYFSSY
jgi:hypothetical protein